MTRLYRRPGNPYWYLDYRDPQTGRRRRVSTKCRTRAEAEAFARRLLGILHGEIPEPAAGVFLSEAVREFLAVRGPTLKSAWRHEQAYRQVLRVLGDRPLGGITVDVLYEYQRVRLGEGVHPTTVRRELAYLSSLMNFGVRRGWVKENPVRGLELPREAPPRRECFTPEEVRRLLETPTTPAMRMAFLISLCTGMRRSEILGLRREDVRLEEGYIVIRRDKAGRSRLVPIPPVLAGELRAYLGGRGEGPIFPWKAEGKVGSPTAFRTAWRGWLRRAGVRRLWFHDVRRTFATYFAMATGNLHELAGILGHGSAYMTQRYAQYVNEFQVRRAEQMEAAAAWLLGKSDLAQNWHSGESR